MGIGQASRAGIQELVLPQFDEPRAEVRELRTGRESTHNRLDTFPANLVPRPEFAQVLVRLGRLADTLSHAAKRVASSAPAEKFATLSASIATSLGGQCASRIGNPPLGRLNVSHARSAGKYG